MKVRHDFVTNSSSSSFIICKDNISHDDLLKVLLEIANKESHYYDDDEDYTEEDIAENCVAYRYHIKEVTKENPYSEYEEFGYGKSEDKTYDNHYIIDNDDCGRYDWDAIEEVLKKHNIPWEYGYCD